MQIVLAASSTMVSIIPRAHLLPLFQLKIFMFLEFYKFLSPKKKNQKQNIQVL